MPASIGSMGCGANNVRKAQNPARTTGTTEGFTWSPCLTQVFFSFQSRRVLCHPRYRIAVEQTVVAAHAPFLVHQYEARAVIHARAQVSKLERVVIEHVERRCVAGQKAPARIVGA